MQTLEIATSEKLREAEKNSLAKLGILRSIHLSYGGAKYQLVTLIFFSFRVKLGQFVPNHFG